MEIGKLRQEEEPTKAWPVAHLTVIIYLVSWYELKFIQFYWSCVKLVESTIFPYM
jgi:hypothetical protein